MKSKLAKIIKISFLASWFVAACFYALLAFTFANIKDSQKNYSWAKFVLKPLINMAAPQKLDFDEIKLQYMSASNKLLITLNGVALYDDHYDLGLQFNQLEVEAELRFFLQGGKFISSIKSDNFKLNMDFLKKNQDPGSKIFNRSEVVGLLDKIYLASDHIYNMSIDLNNGQAFFNEGTSQESAFEIKYLKSSFQHEGYVLDLSFDTGGYCSTLSFIVNREDDNYLMKSRVRDLSLTALRSFFPRSKYRDALIADGVDTMLSADLDVRYDLKSGSKILDLKLNVETAESKGANQLKSLEIDAAVTGEMNRFEIKKLNLVFGNNGKINTVMTGKFAEYGIFTPYSDLPSEIYIDQTFSGIEISQVINFIPSNQAVGFKDWLVSSMNTGMISSGHNKLKLTEAFFSNYDIPDEAIDCRLVLENTKLDYYDEHPDLFIKAANLEFFSEYFYVKSSNITTENGLDVKNVVAKIPYNMENLEIKGSGEGDVKSLIDFINKQDHQIIKREGLNFSNLTAPLKIDFDILVKKTPVEEMSDIKFDINVQSIKNGLHNFEDIVNEIKNIKININSDKKLVIQGSLDYAMLPISFVYDNSYSHQDGKLNMALTVSNDLLRSWSFDNNVKFGKQDLVVGITSLAGGSYKVTCDATASEVIFPKFEVVKKAGSTMLISGNLDSLNMAKFHLSNLVAQSNNVNFKLEVIKSKTFLDIKLQEGRFEQNILNAEWIKDKHIEKFKLNASYMDLSESLEDLIDKRADSKSALNSFEYEIKIKKAKLKDNIFYTDILLQLSCTQDICTHIFLDSTLSGKYEFKINQPSPEHQEKFTVTSDNAGLLLKSLGIYNDLEEGNLRVDLTQNPRKDGSIEKIPYRIDAQASIRDFSTKNSSLLTKLVLGLTTLDGIGSIIGDKNLYFNEMLVNISYSDGIIWFEHGKLSNTGLDITINGNIDLNKKYVIFNGNLIPSVYGINKIVSNMPFFGKILSGGSGGVIDAKYRVHGHFGEIKTSVNPLSMLPIGFFKNLFR